ncbi:hypothetical protein D4764_06G0006550 [Takifugu flavidus]|uniref:Uncharacterized protein n=1 Tax=Takifugu flavidus TaxID=433684 RepID=A0A5C6MW88_9TELE|nr:hypothetical protein D4764_06G0006550 [Takifugu flavidus]
MASSETPPLSIRQGVWIVPPEGSVSVEKVLLAVVEQLVQSGIFIWDLLVQVSPLSVPSVRITVSGIPPFIPNDLLEFSMFKTVNLACKDPKLRHIQSLRRQWFMILDLPSQTMVYVHGQLVVAAHAAASLVVATTVEMVGENEYENITIRTLNINGGRDGQKRALISEVTAQKKMDVLFLQATWKMATAPAVI